MKISTQGEVLIGGKGDNLIFLLSMPRSGSTLLSLMLGSHPEVDAPPEPWIVLAVAEHLGIGNVRNMPYGREWAEIAAIEFLLSSEREQRGALGKALSMIGGVSNLDTISVARKILHAAYQLHLKVSGKRIFIDKTPRYYTVLGLIDEVFPKAKKIVLLRNPLDVFASYKATWDIPRTIFTPENVLVHTRDFCEGLFRLADYTATLRNDVLVLRYEDLANDPERALRSVSEFVDIDFLPTMLTYCENLELIKEYEHSPVGDPVSAGRPQPTNNRTVNAWEQRLELADIQALVGVTGVNIFERLGYEDTVARLREMPVIIPSEEHALERRNVLMQSLVTHVHEQPFSSWNNFASPLKECLTDRAARLEVIHQQQGELAGLRQSLDVSEADRAARLEVIHQQQGELAGLRQNLDASEADRAARLEVIHQQQGELAGLRQSLDVSEADRAARLEVIHQQQGELAGLRQSLDVSEADRAARLEVIHQQQGELAGLRQNLDASEADRAARLEVIHQQQGELAGLRQNLDASEADRAARLEVIHQQQGELAGLRQSLDVSEADRAARLEVIHQQQGELAGLWQNLDASEADRAARLEVIHQQQAELAGLARSIEALDALIEKQKMVTERQESDLENIKKWKGFFIFKLEQLKSRIVNLTKHLFR